MKENGQNGEKKLDENGVRNELGQFVPGHAPLPGSGRPRGRVNLIEVAREQAKEEGISLEDVAFDALMKLRELAFDGDLNAIRELLDRICGPVERGPEVALQINQAIEAGPPPPPTPQLKEGVARLHKLAKQLEIVEEEE